MKLKDFMNMAPGTQVIIKHRKARLQGDPRVGGGGGSFDSKEYGWAFFRYVDTNRQVTKRHRQVEMA